MYVMITIKEAILKKAPVAKKGKKSKQIGIDWQNVFHDFGLTCILDTLNSVMAFTMDITENVMHKPGVKGRYKVFPCQSETLKLDN